jgi:hypothetical protein
MEHFSFLREKYGRYEKVKTCEELRVNYFDFVDNRAIYMSATFNSEKQP